MRSPLDRRRFLASTALAVTSRSAIARAAEKAVRGDDREGAEQVVADLDKRLRLKNVGGTDGAGLCVWASLTMAALYHNCRPLFDLFKKMQAEPGGGWPERVDQKMKQHAPHVKYEQWMGTDLAFIKSQLARGRMVCSTYGYGEFYQMETIAHMVCDVAMSGSRAAILDNNDPDHIWWMSPEERLRRLVHPTGQGWAVAIHLPPPPPTLHNRNHRST